METNVGAPGRDDENVTKQHDQEASNVTVESKLRESLSEESRVTSPESPPTEEENHKSVIIEESL